MKWKIYTHTFGTAFLGTLNISSPYSLFFDKATTGLIGLSKLFLPLPGGTGKSADRGVEAAEVEELLSEEEAEDEADNDDESGTSVGVKAGGAELDFGSPLSCLIPLSQIITVLDL